MVNSGRVMLIDDPPKGNALEKVMASISKNLKGHSIVQTVRMVDDAYRRANASPRADLLAGLEQFEKVNVHGELLESVDIIGHGSPGMIQVGGTQSGSQYQTSGGKDEYAQLSSDPDVLPSLVPFAEKLRSMRADGRLAEGFCVRLLGCVTAVDPGEVATELLPFSHDGAIFIHTLASFLDVPVVGTLAYISVKSFETGEFQAGGDILRTCSVSSVNGVVTFDPAALAHMGPLEDLDVDKDAGPLSAEVVTSGEVWKFGDQKIPQLEVDELFGHFSETGKPLLGGDPLVKVDGVIRGKRSCIGLAEHGKALIVWAAPNPAQAVPPPTRYYRFLPHSRSGGGGMRPQRRRVAASQRAVHRFLTDVVGRPPAWKFRMRRPVLR